MPRIYSMHRYLDTNNHNGVVLFYKLDKSLKLIGVSAQIYEKWNIQFSSQLCCDKIGYKME